MEIDIDILFDMYLNSDDYGQNSLFFLFLNEYYLLKEKGINKDLAHICYLISYLLINITVRIRTEVLSLVFAKKEEGINVFNFVHDSLLFNNTYFKSRIYTCFWNLCNRCGYYKRDF